MKMKLLFLSLLIMISLYGISQAGNLDNSLGGTGRINIPIGNYDDHSRGVAIQPDGKIIVVGESGLTASNGSINADYIFSVSRLNPDGTLDNTFDGDGKVFIPTGDFSGKAVTVLVQPDGKILVGGRGFYNATSEDLTVARLNSNGSIDNTFGVNGVSATPIGFTDDVLYGMALQGDGKIVLMGYSYTDDINVFNGYGISVARLNTNGTLDNTFDNDGKKIIQGNGALYSGGLAVTIQPDGKILLIGSSRNDASPGTWYSTIIRLLPDGGFDNSFDGDGQRTFLTATRNECFAVILQPDGKIVMAGYQRGDFTTTYGSNDKFKILRLNTNGSSDNSFGAGGEVQFDITLGPDQANALALQPDGKIIVVGGTQEISNFQLAAVRLNTDGTFDNSFDNDGIKLLPNARGTGVALQPDGKIVMIAEDKYSLTNPRDPLIDFVVIRLLNGGVVDEGFGADGRVNIPVQAYDDHAYAVAIQTDGKIVIAGPSRTLVSDPTFGNKYDFAAVRLNPDGTLDNSFNGTGKVIIPVGNYGGIPHAVAIQPDGKILIAGYNLDLDADNYDFAVVRLNTNGSIDNSFSGDGKAFISPGPNYDFCFAMALQADGKIVLAGQSITFTDRVFSAARLNSDGSPDLLFGNNNDGKILIPINGVTHDAATSVAIQPNGYIVLAGSGVISTTDVRQIAVARLTQNGSPDPGFGTNGQALPFPGNSAFCNAMVLQPDGKILLAGHAGEGSSPDFHVARLNSNASPDLSFDSDGIVLVPVGTGIDEAYSMVLQPDGKIVVGGHSQVGSSFNFSAIRLNTNATLDICFDGDGKIILPSTTPGGYGERNRAIGLQADGKIILVGNNGGLNTVPTDPTIDFIVMRVNGGSGSGQDLDGDGYNGCVDCNDNNPAVNPGATEICNGIDDNCNGQVDEGLSTTFYRDFDGDGFGNLVNTIQACTVPSGYVANNTDCNDNNAMVYPGANEVCNGVDDDCDGQIDEGLSATFYRDADADGFGNPNNTIQACAAPAGYVSNNSDCDDTKLLYADNDGDGFGAGAPAACGVANNTDCDDTKLLYADGDNDGYGAGAPVACGVENNGDCNDNNPAVRPNATENCNGIDDDCDGQIDEGIPKFTYYFDGDGDGWGIASQTIQACTFPQGYAVNPGDCNDNNASIHPGATELCNGIDEDCDGQVDDGALQAWYLDNDGDGYGSNQFVLQCAAPQGYVALGGDCNDNNASIHPNATETCNGIDDDCDGTIDDGLTLNTYYKDDDGDGYGIMVTVQACSPPQGYANQSGDCNDNNAAIHPGATEICNSIDDDCDGQTDENLVSSWYRDSDGDGYGNPNGLLTVCLQPQGYVANNGDCNDADPAIHPGATEVCNEKDDDCDGQIDEGFTKTTYYKDADGDGYGDLNNSVQACTQPFGYVANNNDCDDGNDTIHPNATEYCNGIDENCNGIIDDNPVLVTWYRDADNDGWGDPSQTVQACNPPSGYIRESFDCNDSNPAINPEAIETANGVDDDCDGQIDEGVGNSTWYRDLDQDGYGDPLNSIQATTQPAGYVSNNTDCDDSKAAVHPGATETCNGIDDDCDGQIDEGVATTAWYIDSDGDGYGRFFIGPIMSCTQPAGYVANASDCNDFDASIHPGATEICNNKDDDCDGQTDEGAEPIAWYIDSDGDGYGRFFIGPILSCTQPAGYVANASDCNDFDASIHPGATEICNGKDDDCDGQIDEGVEPTAWYVDSDGDGYGRFFVGPIMSCTQPAGYVANAGDCNDFDAAIHPGATEICNQKDDDCDGQIDEGVEPKAWYVDSDGDGYGRFFLGPIMSCTQPAGYVANAGDCNDFDASIHPGATEICNEKDDDCDGQIDEGVEPKAWYIDSDGDGYGRFFLGPIMSCTQPAGYAAVLGDCDDTDSTIHPGATEICNLKDDDCDGQTDEGVEPKAWYVDSDGDGYGRFFVGPIMSCTQPAGYVAILGDCNDFNASIHPGATEICNGIDEDCDGLIDEGVMLTFYRDADGDGFGDPNITTQACKVPAGYVTNNADCDDTKLLYADNDNDGYGSGAPVACGVTTNTDCNDTNAAINPGATEICGNNTDENCNGQADEGCPVVPVVTINDVTVYESQGLAVLTISLSGISNTPVRVNYKTIDGTAHKPKDYKNANGNVTIAPGSLSAQVMVTIVPDNLTEGTEYFDVQISLAGQTQVIMGDALGRVTILDGVAPILTRSSTGTGKQIKGTVEIFEAAINPNPSTHDFQISVQSSKNEPFDIRVIDAQGRVVKQIRTAANNFKLGNELRSGVYIIEIRQGSNKKTLKGVKL